MSNDLAEKAEIICACSGTTKAQINNLIANGMDSFEKIAEQTGAGTGCGSCDVLILQLLMPQKPTTAS